MGGAGHNYQEKHGRKSVTISKEKEMEEVTNFGIFMMCQAPGQVL